MFAKRLARAAEVTPQTSDTRLAVMALSALALLQAPVVLVSWDGWLTATVAVGLAIASVYGRLAVLRILAPIIVVNFLVHLVRVQTPIPWRVAHVAVLAGYGAVGLAGLLTLLFKRPFSSALKTSGTLAAAILVAEALIPFVAPASMISDSNIEWTSTPPLDPVTNGTMEPYALVQSIYPDNPRAYLEPWQPPTKKDSRSKRYAIDYSLNALGCRGRDYPIPKPAGRRRILVLGSSSAFGEGVIARDTFSERLEQSLSAGRTLDERYDVINCAGLGLSTREQREFYERVASRYEPDIVIATVSVWDNLSRSEERREGFVHQPSRYEYLLLLTRLIQYARHQAQRPFEYAGTADQLVLLNNACLARSAHVVVAILPDQNRDRSLRLITTVSQKLQPLAIPILDLSADLLKDHAMTDLMVHRFDHSLNDVAHAIAANGLEKLLRQAGLVR